MVSAFSQRTNRNDILHGFQTWFFNSIAQARTCHVFCEIFLKTSRKEHSAKSDQCRISKYLFVNFQLEIHVWVIQCLQIEKKETWKKFKSLFIEVCVFFRNVYLFLENGCLFLENVSVFGYQFRKKSLTSILCFWNWGKGTSGYQSFNREKNKLTLLSYWKWFSIKMLRMK